MEQWKIDALESIPGWKEFCEEPKDEYLLGLVEAERQKIESCYLRETEVLRRAKKLGLGVKRDVHSRLVFCDERMNEVDPSQKIS